MRWLVLSLGLGACLLPAHGRSGMAIAADTDPAELKRIQDEMKAAEDRRKALDSQTQSVEAEAGGLRQRLIDVTAKVQAHEEDVNKAGVKLDALNALEKRLTADLERRRSQTGDLLAALVRLQTNPPPALLVKPDDAVSAARSALLLSAAVPELRAQALDLARQIDNLRDVRAALITEREKLKTAQADLAREQTSLNGLLADRLARQKALSAEAGTEQKTAADLSAKATSLRELIGALEKSAAANMPVTRPAEGPPPAPKPAPKPVPVPGQTAPKQSETPREVDPLDLPADSPLRTGTPAPVPAQPSAAPVTAAAIMAAPTPSLARASGGLPVSGRIVTAYGEPAEGGGVSQGIVIATRAGAPVTAPRDGHIAFAGPFRRYGQLLIIQTAEGYHVILAGMDEVTARVGQDVLAGEPVGIMGSGSSSGPQTVSTEPVSAGTSGPILYVEIRKNGATVNPALWLGRR
ncbi:MAG: peptidoglycan DD-metalloendopeptidase family protein [Parvibaculaceae bacterium]|nr:peptidoglycan DD-metalloendopeptidase family protein [Parvibaculaceae bacterium]